MGRNVVKQIFAFGIVHLFNKARTKGSLFLSPSSYNQCSFTVSPYIWISAPKYSDDLH